MHRPRELATVLDIGTVLRLNLGLGIVQNRRETRIEMFKAPSIEKIANNFITQPATLALKVMKRTLEGSPISQNEAETCQPKVARYQSFV